MDGLKRVGDLEIDQDLDHLRTTWRAQRIGWGVMLLLVIGALAGLLGHGPLAAASVVTEDVRLDYKRFVRHGAVTALRFEVAPGAFTGNEARLWLDREFVEGYEIRSVTPEPDRVSVGGDSLWFTFAVSDPSRPVRINFALQPNAMWLRTGRVGTQSGAPLHFSQFIYP